MYHDWMAEWLKLMLQAARCIFSTLCLLFFDSGLCEDSPFKFLLHVSLCEAINLQDAISSKRSAVSAVLNNYRIVKISGGSWRPISASRIGPPQSARASEYAMESSKVLQFPVFFL